MSSSFKSLKKDWLHIW